MANPKKEMFVDSNPFETRLAVMEEGGLVEFYLERKRDRGITGNIYRGRVVRVLPGMQAVFVEIGLERTAFMHVKDVLDTVDFLEDEEEGRAANPKIQDLLKAGQEVIVQVEKEPIGTKGARLTSYIALPGRYLVLMPTYDRVGVSRRITDGREKRRLRDIVKEVKPEGSGFIIRTVCEGKEKEEIIADMNFLIKLWQSILKKTEESVTPCLLYEELDLTLRSLRDMVTPEIRRFIIEPKEEYDRAIGFIKEFMPGLIDRVFLHKGEEALFDVHGIEVELTNAISKKVWLPSGGFIVIDQMEALTAIDVNTGKYVGKKSPDETILKTNLEASIEVVHQLRLRNIGGIIVIDFIDMPREGDREKVYRTFKDALREDKAKTNILKISELGIVEMTRKRTRESLKESLLEPCPYCDGDGLIKRKDTVAMEVYRALLKELSKKKKAVVYVSPLIAERLGDKGGAVEELRKRLNKKVAVKAVNTFHQEEYEIV